MNGNSSPQLERLSILVYSDSASPTRPLALFFYINSSCKANITCSPARVLVMFLLLTWEQGSLRLEKQTKHESKISIYETTQQIILSLARLSCEAASRLSDRNHRVSGPWESP